MKRRICAIVPLITCMSATAMAEPTIYKGTIGKRNIVAEFADDIATATKPIAGRYFYPEQGVDIPLDPVSAGSGRAELDEEKPCNREICIDEGGGKPVKAPVNARWRLTVSSKKAEIVGTWQSKSGQSLPINLQRVASRSLGKSYQEYTTAGKAYAKTPEGLASIANEVDDDSRPFNQISPYDFLKMQVTLQQGFEAQWGNVAFRYVTDPRTKFAFPRITRLGAPVNAGHPANAYLERRHWQLSLNDLSCTAAQYAGLGWNNAYPEEGEPDPSGIDGISVEVDYLSPTVMSWSTNGTAFCGGAHPSHLGGKYTLDVRRGEPLDPSRIFRDWVAHSSGKNEIVDLAVARSRPTEYHWGPDGELKKFLLAKAEEEEPGFTEECELNDMIKDKVSLSFKQGDYAVFSLYGLPSAIDGVCQGSFFEAPLADLRQFLTPEAVDYFPSLKSP